MILEEGFSRKFGGLVSSGKDEIPLVNDSGAEGGVIKGTDTEKPSRLCDTWNVKVTVAGRCCIGAVCCREKADGGRMGRGELHIIMEKV